MGNPQESAILDVAKTVITLTGSGSAIIFEPLPEDDPLQRKPDISLAERELAWRPHVGLEEGLTETIAYFDDLLREMGHLPREISASRGRWSGKAVVGETIRFPTGK